MVEAYLDTLDPGANTFHLIFEQGGNPVQAEVTSITASHDGGPAVPLRVVRLSLGHYAAITILGSGHWSFAVRALTGGKAPAAFTVTRVIR